MDWVYLALVCVHLLIGLFCGHLAYAARHRAEPWFLAFEASVEATPVMLPEDLAAAGPAIESVVKKFG